jgi:hypothetical protein
VTDLRQQVRELMISIHLVRPQLVDEWMTEMDEEEVERRFRMYARLGFTTEAELSVAGPKFTAVNVLLPGCDARTDDGRPHGTQPCSRENRMRKAKVGQPMPDSGKVNRVRSGSRVVRTEEVSGSGGRDRTRAECGAM